MPIDTAYYLALSLATNDDGDIDNALALSWFYRLLVGGEDVRVH